MMQDEKRKHIRHALSGLVAVVAENDSGSEPFDVHVFDVSAGGAGFTAGKELNIGEHVTFTFSLPGGHEKKVGLAGKIVRVEQINDPSGEITYKYGLKINRFITGIDEENLDDRHEITISLPEEDLKRLHSTAEKEGVSSSEIISRLIRNNLFP